MALENDTFIEDNFNEDIDVDLDTVETSEEDETTSEEVKPKENLQARRAKLARMLAQVDKKLGKTNKPEKTVEKQEVSKEEGLDRMDKFIARAEGIKSQEELALLEEFKTNTGRSVEEILDNRAFKAELKALREEKASEEATPRGNNRGSGSPKTSVEYWLAKDQLPPASEPELRKQVVNAKINRAKSTSQFSDNPIIG